MKRLVRKNILKVQPYIPGKPIEEVERELGLRNVVKLASNESPFGPDANVIKAIAKQAANLNRYPEGSCFYLRKKLSMLLGVSENQLVFGNGSDELIVLATKVLIDPGDEVVIATPTFLIYEIASQIAGAKIKKVPMKDFRYDLVAMKKAISKKTKIVFIANPDNPTGSYVSQKELDSFLSGLPRNLIVFIDEAYYELVDKKDYPDTLKLLEKGKNLIITRTFSKAYSLAGLRVGYGVTKPEIADYLNRVREPFNVNSLAQVAALKSLENKKRISKIKKLLKSGKRLLCQAVVDMGLDFVPTATNFILINVKQDSTKVCLKLLRQGVIVRDMKAWKLCNFIRVTIGTTKENKRFINALRRAI